MHVFQAIEGDQVHMRVPHLVADNHHTDAFARDYLFHRFRHDFAEKPQARVEFVFYVKNILDFLLGDAQCMPIRLRAHVEKGEVVFCFSNFVARNLAIDDAGEYGRHVGWFECEYA